MVEIYTKYKRPKKDAERPYGKKMVETAGYIPAKKQIENLIMAGERLEAFRSGMYDFPEGEIDENFEDPTRDPDFDIADASQLDRATSARLAEAEKLAKEEKKAKAIEEKAQLEKDAKELEELRKEKKDSQKAKS